MAPTINPPTIPTKLAAMARIGMAIKQPSTRGMTIFLIGEVPSARMASICSVTAMEPSSAAMPEPARAATMMAVSTGAISRESVSATTPPTLPPRRANSSTSRAPWPRRAASCCSVASRLGCTVLRVASPSYTTPIWRRPIACRLASEWRTCCSREANRFSTWGRASCRASGSQGATCTTPGSLRASAPTRARLRRSPAQPTRPSRPLT